MKRILIVSPHFPPSNLAAVHRSRLLALHLPEFGWEPIILTVHESFYEEKLDWNLYKLLPEQLKIEKVKAFRITKPRVIGDIGLRSFLQLYKKAKAIILTERIDFLYIPIPSFYCALLGRLLHGSTGVKYGIDYIDPWVHEFPGSDKRFSRHWWSSQLAKFLEPIAVKNASLITGVAEGYYEGVKKRNPYLQQQCIFGAMPYGGEPSDHKNVHSIELDAHLFEEDDSKIQLVYAGAMLPKAHQLLEMIMASIVENPELFEKLEIHFIGTGKSPDDSDGYNIKMLAEKYGLWKTIIYEYPARIPYLSVLKHLEKADGAFILGSTEAHYTPSKTFQAVLSKRPVLAILHSESTAASVLVESNAGKVLRFNSNDVAYVKDKFPSVFQDYLQWLKTFNPLDVDTEIFSGYSAGAVTKYLASLLNKIV